MSSLFKYPAFVQYDYFIGILHGAQAVSNDDYGLSRENLLQVFDNDLFIIRIQCISRLIKKKVLRILINSPCNQDSLFLPLTDTFAFGPQNRLKSAWQGFDKSQNIRFLTNFL